MTEINTWLKRLNTVIDEQLKQQKIDNQQLARLMNVSERQFFRKMKQATDRTPRQYLRQYRLQKAMNYLEKGEYQTVNEVAYAVGYINVGYFITQFEQLFGKRPLQVLRENGWR